MQDTNGALTGLRVLDLTRVLAGPTCTQMLADLGAEIIKIERPGAGDDTRGFAPPYVPNTRESAYFVGVNRNKKSVTLDISTPAAQAILHRLLAQSDILVENFKVGTPLLRASRRSWPFVQLGYADAGYQGPRVRTASPIRIEIVRKPDGQTGFAVHAKRWVVERFFAWINRNRRLTKDFEATIASAETFLYAASAIILLRRLAR